LQLNLDQYVEARNSLIDKDLIAFDGTLFQVLNLPANPIAGPTPKTVSDFDQEETVYPIAQLLKQTFKDI
jgi:hypothetical protein